MQVPKPLVLIACADAVAAVLFDTVLDTHGFDTFIAADGFDAADVALSRRPALVVLDRLLPGLDALSVCRLLKARRATDHIPIVVVTPYDSRAERDQVLEAGADQLLVEPCAPELLALESKRLVAHVEEVRAAEQMRRFHRRAGDTPAVKPQTDVR
jgi:two-component system phosphate regulon response regulator PhoB